MHSLKAAAKPILFIVWVLIIALAVWGYLKLNIPLAEYPEMIKTYLGMFGAWGPILYIIVYAIRPVIFFPATLLTIASGFLFGPWYGIAYTIVGENISANIAFFMGRYFGKDLLERHRSGKFHSLITRMEDEGFMTVLLMRLLYFPFDFTNFFSGTTRIKWSDYALATVIGIIPGLTTFVLFGGAAGSATGVNEGKTGLTFGLSITFFVASLLLSRYLKRRYSKLAEYSGMDK